MSASKLLLLFVEGNCLEFCRLVQSMEDAKGECTVSLCPLLFLNNTAYLWLFIMLSRLPKATLSVIFVSSLFPIAAPLDLWPDQLFRLVEQASKQASTHVSLRWRHFHLRHPCTKVLTFTCLLGRVLCVHRRHSLCLADRSIHIVRRPTLIII